eukprot:scaffold4985_cov188-Prasinococcus_capsulatus_cf.AAC.1
MAAPEAGQAAARAAVAVAVAVAVAGADAPKEEFWRPHHPPKNFEARPRAGRQGKARRGGGPARTVDDGVDRRTDGVGGP